MPLKVTSRLAQLVATFQKIKDIDLLALYNVLREIVFVIDANTLKAGPGIIIGAGGIISVDPKTIPGSTTSGIPSPSPTNNESSVRIFLTMGA